MHEISWHSKLNMVLSLADEVFRAGNERLDLSDRRIWMLAPSVGCELFEALQNVIFFQEEDDSGQGDYSARLFDWLSNGFKHDGYEDWSAAQLLASYAAYLVDDTESMLDDLPAPDCTVTMYGWNWRRDQVIEHCAANILDALQACQLGRELIGRKITPNTDALERIRRQTKGLTELNQKKSDVQKIAREIASELWTHKHPTHRINAMADAVYRELIARGYQDVLPDHPSRVRFWLKPVAPASATKPGRPNKKKTP